MTPRPATCLASLFGLALLSGCAADDDALQEALSERFGLQKPYVSQALAAHAQASAAAYELKIRGPDVEPHVSEFAKALCERTGACTISTYLGHRPSPALALDILVSDAYGYGPTDNGRLSAGVRHFIETYADVYGVEYQISEQRLRTYSSRHDWRRMEDRGGLTENHFDHVHVGFRRRPPAFPDVQKRAVTRHVPNTPLSRS